MSRRAVFLDRDGVINRPAAPGDYIRRWDQFELLEPAVDWIRLFNALGLLVIVVTNQRGVALGLMTEAALEEIHVRMREQLRQRGAVIDDVFACTHAEDACNCRKPRPGLVLAAQAKWEIDLAGSILIGDSDRDRGLAANCGLRFVEVRGGRVA